MTSTKTSRGIQREDVWAAADALIAQGLRPTIERVRQHMGRGSPNTVSPMLEAWFATLGPRLGVSGATPDDPLPPAVRQAAANLWEMAQSAAHEAASQAVAAERKALDHERTALEAAQSGLAQREQALSERQAAMDDALRAAHAQMADLSVRLAEAHRLLAQRDQELLAARSRLEVMAQDRETLRSAYDDAMQAHAAERQRLEDRYASTERRWLVELDRARHETKQAKAAATDQERRAQLARTHLEAENGALQTQLQEARNESGVLREALTLAQQHTEELRELLASQPTPETPSREQRPLRTAGRFRQPPLRKKLIRQRR